MAAGPSNHFKESGRGDRFRSCFSRRRLANHPDETPPQSVQQAEGRGHILEDTGGPEFKALKPLRHLGH